MVRKRLKLQTAGIAKKRKKRRLFRLTLFSLFIFSIIFGASRLSYANFLTIKEVEVLGLDILEKKEIVSILDQKIEKPIFGLFSRSNIFFFPRSEIKEDILSSFESISEIEISIKNFSIIEISVKERKPFALWCGQNFLEQEVNESDLEASEVSVAQNSENDIKFDELEIEDKEECFFIDETGFIFSEAHDEDHLSFVKHYGNLDKTEDNNYFLDSNIFKDLHNFLNRVSESFSVKAEEINVSKDEVEVLLDTDTKLILIISGNFEDLFENLTVFINDPEFQKEVNMSIFEKFEHIDLRFDNKILYKLKDNN